MGRLHVFTGYGAAHRGFMHADDFGHLHHRQRLEEGDAFVHELALSLHDFVSDVQNSLLPLVQALDQKFTGADFFPDVFADFR